MAKTGPVSHPTASQILLQAAVESALLVPVTIPRLYRTQLQTLEQIPILDRDRAQQEAMCLPEALSSQWLLHPASSLTQTYQDETFRARGYHSLE
jgi:hypothetical protein